MKFFMALVSLIALSTQPALAQKSPALKAGDSMPINLFVELGKLVNPAVVNISTAQRVQRRPPRGGYPGVPNDPFWHFFEEFMGPNDRMQRPAQALGTGFIVEDDGLIITNAHVINQADEIKVQMVGDKKLYDAELIGKDERADIALIRIKAGKKLPTVTLGSSETVEVGEWVAAFGNPFGHTNSMSKGIISAKGRALSELNAFPFLQTDASINPGNSGGPLVNTRGEVIGVNTAIDARAQGIGFAIPIDSVKTLLPQLKTKGRVPHGFLGVGLADIDPRGALQLGLKSDEGALVVSVSPGSPAAVAGVDVYDFVTKFNEREIKSARDLMNAVLDAPLGKAVPMELIRDGNAKTLKVTLTERDDKAMAQGPARSSGGAGKGDAAPHGLGFRVSRLTRAAAIELNLAYLKEEPPVVTQIENRSPAANGGLQVGDVILDVNRKRVKTPQDVVKNLKAGTNTLRVARPTGTAMVFIEGK
ncbi:MAG TPA: trypsin-like peptidase domain-containing protein [Bdellovibrionales bacterium]|nr:trypsin-like peptidase domain-containing protein [Bdellovibrionales bacterium]